MDKNYDSPLWDLVVWNGYAGQLEMFRGTEADACELAQIHRETGDNVIYFFAKIKSVTLREY